MTADPAPHPRSDQGAGLEQGDGPTLVALARSAIAAHLGIGDVAGPPPGGCPSGDGAAFVTLTLAGRLRGCIGTLEPYRPLVDDVRDNAVSAAVRDPRFPALTVAEFADTRVEVSVLSPAVTLPVRSRAEALAALRPHVDGVILRAGRHRGTFLPQVWEQLPDPEDFLDHLVVKAHLPRGYWGDDVTLATYTVTAWRELGPGGDVEAVPAQDGTPRP